MERLIVAVFFCDFCSNVFEVSLQEYLQQRMLPELSVIKYLLMIAAVRTLFAAVALIGEKQYRVLLKKDVYKRQPGGHQLHKNQGKYRYEPRYFQPD